MLTRIPQRRSNSINAAQQRQQALFSSRIILGHFSVLAEQMRLDMIERVQVRFAADERERQLWVLVE